VRTLADSEWPAGSHTTSWDGRGASGDPVAPGIDFYRLAAAGREVTRRMARLR
jgi:hypothetical protein